MSNTASPMTGTAVVVLVVEVAGFHEG